MGYLIGAQPPGRSPATGAPDESGGSNPGSEPAGNHLCLKAEAYERIAMTVRDLPLAGITVLDFGQIYVAIADPAPDGTVPARLYWKPLVTLIWLGAAAMALGGALSLADRRLRFGAAVRAQTARYAAKLNPPGFFRWLLSGQPPSPLTFRERADTRRLSVPGAARCSMAR